MAVRLYLANAAASYTPPTIRGTWSDKVNTAASKLIPRKTGTGVTAAKAETSTSSSWSVLLRRFVSEPINNAATLNGAASLCIGVLESNDAANDFLQLHMFVTVGNTDVVRGVLTSLALVSAAEFPSGGANSAGKASGQLLTIASLTSVGAQPGDRIVLELGYKAANTVNTSYTGTVYYGGTGTDLSDGNVNVTSRPGWVDFSAAGFDEAFAQPHRSGATTTTLGVTTTLPVSRKKMTYQSVTELHVESSLPSAHKSMKTVTTVRPPGRPPVGTPEEGSFTYGFRSASVETETHPTIGTPSTAYHDSQGAESLTDCTVYDVSYAYLAGDHDISPPDIDLLTSPPPRPKVSPVRFIAQDIRTHRYLNWELPLVDPKITFTLSGMTLLSAVLRPESPSLRELKISPWATWIHIEQGGQLLGTCVLVPAAIEGDEYTVEAIGFSGYAQDMPYFSEDLYVNADACEAVRRIWGHLQSYPDAYLGVEFDTPAVMCGLLLGIPAHQDRDPDTGELLYDDVTTQPDDPEDPNAGTQKSHSVGRGSRCNGGNGGGGTGGGTSADPSTDENGVITVHNSDGSTTVRTPRIVEADPYVLAWYSDIDCGQEIDNLAKVAQFDYRETVWWDNSEVLPEAKRKIEIGYPRLGRKRFDLRVAQDENMLDAIPLREDGDSGRGYASQIMTRGKGEGRDAVRGYAGMPDPHRVRRVGIVSDKTIQTPVLANQHSTEEVLRRRAAVTVGEVLLMDWHPNAPIGSFQVGDEFLITGFVAWAGFIELWHRIVSYDWEPDKNLITCQTRRSEQFAYGDPARVQAPTAETPT
jgi:hypothetical protein